MRNSQAEAGKGLWVGDVGGRTSITAEIPAGENLAIFLFETVWERKGRAEVRGP